MSSFTLEATVLFASNNADASARYVSYKDSTNFEIVPATFPIPLIISPNWVGEIIIKFTYGNAVPVQ